MWVEFCKISAKKSINNSSERKTLALANLPVDTSIGFLSYPPPIISGKMFPHQKMSTRFPS